MNNIIVVTDSWLDDELRETLNSRPFAWKRQFNYELYNGEPSLKKKDKRRVITKKIDLDLLEAKTEKARRNMRGFKARTAFC